MELGSGMGEVCGLVDGLGRGKDVILVIRFMGVKPGFVFGF